MAERHGEAVAVTSGGPHYFGYYDIQPFNGRQTHLLVLTPPFQDREPAPDDVCEIGLVELATRKYERLTETRAWNFQQGCFIHWHPQAPDDRILYNDRIGDRFVCCDLNIQTGARRVLPRPVSAIDRTGQRATSLSFARLAVTRPGYGYVGLPDAWGDDPAPEQEGVWVMDLATGDHLLAVSLAQLAELYPDREAVEGQMSWFNHNVISDDGRRFIFLHRFRPNVTPPPRSWTTGLFTADMADGGNLRHVTGYGLVSHFDWYRSEAVLVFANHGGGDQNRFWLVPDGEGEASTVAEDEWQTDGHCSYSSDYRWILNDTYPMGERREQSLRLHCPEDGRHVPLGAYAHLGPRDPVAIRCDLHPRFSRDDTLVCFDSTHEGVRQVYVMEVGEITKS